MSDPQTIRIGIMCHGTTFRRWQAQVIESLAAMDGVSIDLLIVDAATRDDAPKGNMLLRKLRNVRPARLLYQLWMNLLFRPACRRDVDLSDLLRGVPRMDCRVTIKGRHSQHFSDADINAIREYRLDAMLRFGFNIIRGDILTAARYGVWSFHHDDESKYRGSPSCFWEIYHGDPVSGAMLQRLTDTLDGGVVLRKGYFPTIDWSWSANMDRVYAEAAAWPAQVCRELQRGCTRSVDALPSTTTAPIYTPPTNRQMLAFAARLMRNRIKHWYRRYLCRETWNIGVIDRPIHAMLHGSAGAPTRWLAEPPAGTFHADPFGITHNGDRHMLFEAYGEAQRKGRIATMPVDGREPTTIIDTDAHLSYPFAFEHDGNVYCIPETWQTKRVDLYRAEQFPHRWTHAATLLDGVVAVDPTVFQFADRWWLLFVDGTHRTHANLLIYHADALTGPWLPHARNPVKTDARSARPAGTPFIHRGILYRPAQDCAGDYGSRVVIHRVTQLSVDQFEEHSVAMLEPDRLGPYPHGLHTVSAFGDTTLIDGKRWRFDPLGALPRFVRRNQ
jgi:hypothetical protein